MAVRIPCEVRVVGGPRTPILTESRHLLGPAEGTWWTKYSWWVIPLGIALIVLPLISLFRSGDAPHVQPVIVPPVVIQQTPPAPVAPTLSVPSGELTAEELDRRHSEYLRRRD